MGRRASHVEIELLDLEEDVASWLGWVRQAGFWLVGQAKRRLNRCCDLAYASYNGKAAWHAIVTPVADGHGREVRPRGRAFGEEPEALFDRIEKATGHWGVMAFREVAL